MSGKIPLRTPEGVLLYRRLKIGVGAVAGFGAVVSLASSPRPRDPGSRPLRTYSVAETAEALQTRLPLAPADRKGSAFREVGTFVLAGRGPAGATGILFDGRDETARFVVPRDGRWRASASVRTPGTHAFRVRFRRGDAPAGGTAELQAAFLAGPRTAQVPPASERDPRDRPAPADRTAAVEDIRITNVAPKDRLPLGRFTLRGIAPPGDFVRVYVDATLLGRAEVDLEGRWSYKPRVKGPGRRTFTVLDEITQRQFGPLAVVLVGKPAPKPPRKPAKVPKPPAPPLQ